MLIADMILASMLWPKTDIRDWESTAPTQLVLQNLIDNEPCSKTLQRVQELKTKHQFFHWHLAFPMVHRNGGFDVVIGNPPYLDSELLTKNFPYQRLAMTHLYESTKGKFGTSIFLLRSWVLLLKLDGYHAFVTPNKYWVPSMQHFRPIRVFLQTATSQAYDFSGLSLFDGANVAVVIVVTQKKRASPTEKNSLLQI